MQPERRNTPRLLIGLICGLTLMGACVQPPESGVSVRAVAADLIFGIPPLPEPVEPPNIDTTPDEPTGVVRIGDGPSPPPPPPPPPRELCPVAPPTEFPDEAAPTVVGSNRPQAGQYLWVVNGYQDVPDLGRMGLPTTTNRVIVGVEESGVAGGEFSFTTREREIVFGSQRTIEQTFRVEPQAGIWLTQIVTIDSQGNRASFNPQPEILYLSMPAKLGDTVDTVGIDPLSQEVLRHEGTLIRRHRVDACGEVIDSWLVQATQEFTSVTQQRPSKTYNYAIGTQFGGIIVFEHVETPPNDPDLVFDARIGQTAPR